MVDKKNTAGDMVDGVAAGVLQGARTTAFVAGVVGVAGLIGGVLLGNRFSRGMGKLTRLGTAFIVGGAGTVTGMGVGSVIGAAAAVPSGLHAEAKLLRERRDEKLAAAGQDPAVVEAFQAGFINGEQSGAAKVIEHIEKQATAHANAAAQAPQMGAPAGGFVEKYAPNGPQAANASFAEAEATKAPSARGLV